MCVVQSGGILTHVFLSTHQFPRYLESNGWIVEDALRAAMEDGEWEKDLIETRNSNDIEIKVVNGQFIAKGAGLKKQKTEALKMMLYSDGIPAISTKTVRPQDVYNVSFDYCWADRVVTIFWGLTSRRHFLFLLFQYIMNTHPLHLVLIRLYLAGCSSTQ
jgi:hypothetical protein